MIYNAGWNMPGYLPETDPETCEDFDSAKGYLAATIERFRDSDYDVLDEDEVSAKWDELLEDLNGTAQDEDWGGYTGDSSLFFWIARL
jgi:hypothetical protein